MNQVNAGQSGSEKQKALADHAVTKSQLTKLAMWVDDRNIPFLVTSVCMIVMLLWAGSYKMTAPGAEGIVPLVSNSPLASWQFKLFGPYIGSDLIGLTEIAAAVLFIVGYLNPKAGIVGGLITSIMFFTTSSMIITTPGATVSIHGIRYMSFWVYSFSRMSYPSAYPSTSSAPSAKRLSLPNRKQNDRIQKSCRTDLSRQTSQSNADIKRSGQVPAKALQQSTEAGTPG